MKVHQSHRGKIIFFLLLLIIVELVTFCMLVYFKDFGKGKNPEIGVTFSKAYAESLGLDWQKTYLAIIDDLKVENIRLIAQWNEVEPEFNQFNFNHLDWMIDQAAQRNVKVILVVGRRVPRWPECHDPVWLSPLPAEKIEIEQLKMIQTVVEHFKVKDNIKMWQVENEPFLTEFGECPEFSLSQVKKEIALVKTLDDRPILITDSGELSSWFKTGNLGDKFGHTMYRSVYSELLGFSKYMLPASFYRIKAGINGLALENVIVAELQAEPWVPDGYNLDITYDKMKEQMDKNQIESNI